MPTSERPPSFLFEPLAFVGDKKLAAMTAEQIGAYWLLCCYAWEEGGALDADDDAALAALSRLGARWPENREAVLRPFKRIGKRIVQPRLAEEYAATVRRIEGARLRGANAATYRWGPKKTASDANDLDATGMREQCQPWHTNTVHNTSTPTPAASLRESAQDSPSAAPEPVPVASDAAALVRGLADSLSTRGRDDARELATTPEARSKRAELAWRWLSANADEIRARGEMRFVGWLLKTGTTDPETLLALVKHKVVHAPRNAHAYYTAEGTARQVVAMGVASDRAIAEHERIKREERAFLAKGRKP